MFLTHFSFSHGASGRLYCHCPCIYMNRKNKTLTEVNYQEAVFHRSCQAEATYHTIRSALKFTHYALCTLLNLYLPTDLRL